jgi:hypothetical protein
MDLRPGWEAIFSQPAGTPKALHAKWPSEVELRISALRAAKGGKGRDLTTKPTRWLVGGIANLPLSMRAIPWPPGRMGRGMVGTNEHGNGSVSL